MRLIEMASALELSEIRGFVIIVHQNLFCQRGAALMSLAPIEAGEVCQDLLTDHFCPHRWAASATRPCCDGLEVPHRWLRRLSLSRGISLNMCVDHQSSSELTPHHCDSGDMFRAEQHRRGRILLNTSPTGLSSPGARPLL